MSDKTCFSHYGSICPIAGTMSLFSAARGGFPSVGTALETGGVEAGPGASLQGGR